MPRRSRSWAAAAASTLDDDVFGAPFNGPLVHEVVRAELAARRQGTHSTKTRGKVRGGGAKPWRQKGTGRARAGSLALARSGPAAASSSARSPRHYTFKVNRKARRAALRSALSVHAERGSIARLRRRRRSTRRRPSRPPTLLGRLGPRRPGARRARPTTRRARRSSRSATSTRVLGAAASRTSAWPTSIGAAALLVLRGRARRAHRARQRRSASRGGRGVPMDAEPGDHPPGRLREELRARGGRQVHVPRPRRRAQDPDPPGRRGALRGHRGSPSAPSSVPVEAQAPRRDRAAARGPGRRPMVQVREGQLDSDLPVAPGHRRGVAHGRFASPSPPRPVCGSFSYPDFAEITKKDPGADPRRGPQEVGWSQQLRPQDLSASGRWRQAPVPQDRLQAHARTACRRRSPRSSTTRTARRTSRCCTTPTATSATSWRRSGCASAAPWSRDRTPTSRSGTALPLDVGTVVHNVELKPGRGGQLGRSAGTPSSSWPRRATRATLRLPSGEMRMVTTSCRATIGTIGNVEHQNINIGKAGRSHKGLRPQTRHRDTPSTTRTAAARARPPRAAIR